MPEEQLGQLEPRGQPVLPFWAEAESVTMGAELPRKGLSLVLTRYPKERLMSGSGIQMTFLWMVPYAFLLRFARPVSPAVLDLSAELPLVEVQQKRLRLVIDGCCDAFAGAWQETDFQGQIAKVAG